MYKSKFCTANSSLRTAGLFAVLAVRVCLGQGTPLQVGTVVTGQCQGHESEPGCVLPNLFGPQGLTLFPQGPFPHYAHFVGNAQTTLNRTLSTAIATQLAILPIISPASGFTYTFDQSTGTYARSASNLGPIYTERAETIGRGKIFFGVSYQRFRFSNLDGIDLHNVPAVFAHLPNTGPASDPSPTYEADVIQTNNNIDIKMDQTMLYGTVGITDHIDVSVAVPIVSVRVAGTSAATIIRVSGPTFTLPGVGTIPNPHSFNAAGSLTNTFTSNGSASGIGDVTFRAKANIFQNDQFRLAVALDVRAPTGDARQLLGSGAPGVKPFAILSMGKRFSPHVNIGYQWNGDSILAGDVTGTTFTESATGSTLVQNGPAVKQSLPNQFFYSAGVDLGVSKDLTLVADYLGQVLQDAPRVFRTNFVTRSIPGGPGSQVFPSISGGQDTIGLNNGAVGVKFSPFGRFLISANLMFRLDNRGLRQDVTPLIALSYQLK